MAINGFFLEKKLPELDAALFTTELHYLLIILLIHLPKNTH